MPNVDRALKQKLREILLSLDKTPEGRAVLGKLRAVRFVRTGPEDYKPVMDLARDAGIDLESYYYENR